MERKFANYRKMISDRFTDKKRISKNAFTRLSVYFSAAVFLMYSFMPYLKVTLYADEITSIDINAASSDGGVLDTSGAVAEPEPYNPPSSESIFNRYFSQPAAYEITGRELESARADKANTEKKLDQTQDDIEDLEDEQSDIRTYLIQVNDKLQSANQQLAEYEELVENKSRDIDKARATIEDAKKQQEKRKSDMKGRIKYMYEQGSESYLDILLTARSFSDFLNKAQYFESINQYDRKMLDVYAKREVEISALEEDLQDQKVALETLTQETEQKAMAVYQEVIEASASMKEYSEQIAEKEAQALAYEQEIEEKEQDIQSLMEQYKKELALSAESAAMGSRDLSDVVFANGDLDLMAAMIECEAGGESYTGKVAVGAVILNRVRSPKFPSTVLEVLMQNRQFSPVASGRFAMVLARGANASCYQAAQDAMAGASPVGNCLFFRTPIPGLVGQQIGGHIFY